MIWYLSAEPRRFGELRHDIPRISARVLSTRLRELEARGLVTRQLLDTSPPSAEYALTALGRELLPAIHALASVGQKLITQWGGSDKYKPAKRRPAQTSTRQQPPGRARPTARSL